jgi:antitoxin VapB
MASRTGIVHNFLESSYRYSIIHMALSIKHPEADRLARELAARTGETLTEAVVVALRERLTRETGRANAFPLRQELARHSASVRGAADDRQPGCRGDPRLRRAGTARGRPLLCKGGDFQRTDIARVCD